MKRLLFLCLSIFAAAGWASAQNDGSFSSKTSMYTSPPNVTSNAKANEHPDLIYAKPGTATEGIRLINGSFELNSGQCIVNGSNNVITANVLATTAFGCAGEIDLMNNFCGWGLAKSGSYFLCLANGNRHCGDACNLELTANLIAGNTYTISYFDRGYDTDKCCKPSVALEVGISADPTKQGMIVYTSPRPTLNVWSQRTFTFIAPNDGKYLSFHAKDSAGRWTHIDSVTISANACNAPFNLKVRNITSTSAELTWDVPAEPVKFLKIIGGEKGSAMVIRKQQESSDKRAVVKDLLPNTTYEWAMKGVCDDGKSIASHGPDFTTLLLGDVTNNIKIFPNPASDQLHIDGLQANQRTKLSIVDFLGNVRLVAFATANSYSWNIATLQAGSYFLRIESGDGTVSRWFIKE